MGHAVKNWFRLSSKPSSTEIACSEDGLFVGDVPLLERTTGSGNVDEWRPRNAVDLNTDLSKRFGLPIDCQNKMAGLAAVARALNRGDLAHAQMAALHLRIPAPQPLTKSAHSTKEIVELAMKLHASGMLKADWDSEKHPRWLAGTPDGVGGEFAPAGSGNASTNQSGASLMHVQLAIPVPPMDVPFPEFGPLPFEILPPPVAVPQAIPRELPRNPYPRNPKCAEEWAEAEEFCEQLRKKRKLGRGDDGRNRGFGQWMSECLKGRVSAECGGNSTDAFEVIA
jgi:hypothetical protein